MIYFIGQPTCVEVGHYHRLHMRTLKDSVVVVSEDGNTLEATTYCISPLLTYLAFLDSDGKLASPIVDFKMYAFQ